MAARSWRHGRARPHALYSAWGRAFFFRPTGATAMVSQARFRAALAEFLAAHPEYRGQVRDVPGLSHPVMTAPMVTAFTNWCQAKGLIAKDKARWVRGQVRDLGQAANAGDN